MRDIKFRAWDRWNNQYFENLNNIFITGNGEIGIVDKYGHNLIDEYQERFVSEFSTGLKDQNGVEIYVNDVLKDFDENVIVGFVEYDEAYGEYSCGDDSLYESTRNCVVVGNIHANNELLGEQK